MFPSGPAFLSSCPLQISSLAIICGRLWLGTGSGAIFSIPVLLSSESASIPYCSLPGAQLCYHGHRQAVKFIVSAAEGLTVVEIFHPSGDDGSDNSPDALHQRSERSHMIIWQSSSPSVPSPSL
ncbi:hypothetical protein Z043_103174 [Scleropages formosus]|uniref:Uncharacterized protein n=1 Tax=Scleropages formosus TaxID=113540 RepID=A0A0N8K2D2_SCLFO|nr:hypothetical protein Z043_103174 [Scleropages formosus]